MLMIILGQRGGNVTFFGIDGMIKRYYFVTFSVYEDNHDDLRSSGFRCFSHKSLYPNPSNALKNILSSLDEKYPGKNVIIDSFNRV